MAIQLDICKLGRLPYDDAWDAQKELVEARKHNPDLRDQLLLLEHPPTYTLGRRGSLDNLLLTEQQIDQLGFCLRWVDRGGDITYHGPGQLVGYPILNLKRWFGERGKTRADLHAYLRDLEEVIIQTLAQLGIHGWRFPGYTGVWVDRPNGAEKIAAIGIKVSPRGVSSHGFALNVNPEMTHFGHIIPCGIDDHGVTSLTAVLGRQITIDEVMPILIEQFLQIFQHTPQYSTSLETRNLSSE